MDNLYDIVEDAIVHDRVPPVVDKRLSTTLDGEATVERILQHCSLFQGVISRMELVFHGADLVPAGLLKGPIPAFSRVEFKQLIRAVEGNNEFLRNLIHMVNFPVMLASLLTQIDPGLYKRRDAVKVLSYELNSPHLPKALLQKTPPASILSLRSNSLRKEVLLQQSINQGKTSQVGSMVSRTSGVSTQPTHLNLPRTLTGTSGSVMSSVLVGHPIAVDPTTLRSSLVGQFVGPKIRSSESRETLRPEDSASSVGEQSDDLAPTMLGI